MWLSWDAISSPISRQKAKHYPLLGVLGVFCCLVTCCHRPSLWLKIHRLLWAEGPWESTLNHFSLAYHLAAENQISHSLFRNPQPRISWCKAKLSPESSAHKKLCYLMTDWKLALECQGKSTFPVSECCHAAFEEEVAGGSVRRPPEEKCTSSGALIQAYECWGGKQGKDRALMNLPSPFSWV